MEKKPDVLEAMRLWITHHGLIFIVIVIATLAALKVAAVVSRALFARLFRGKKDDNSEKMRQTLSTMANWLISITIVCIAWGFLLREVGVNMEHVGTLFLAWALTNGLGSAIIIVLTFGGLKIAGLLTDRLVMFLNRDEDDFESKKRADTLTSVIRWVLRTAILLTALVMLLGQFGVQIGPIIAAAGVVGLAVGFGAQNLVADVISGFFLLLEDQLRVGDVVQLNDKSGAVEKITLRMTILRDFAGSVIYIRNGKIDVVTNMTKEFSFAVFDIGVAYREDTDQVIKVISVLGQELQADSGFKDVILAAIEIAGVDKFADSAVMIKARMKTRPSKQWMVAREFNRRLKKKFDELGIEIPFPHVTIYPGVDKSGKAPALKLEFERKAQMEPATAEESLSQKNS
jgi:small-conductance mechanosensitive channel